MAKLAMKKLSCTFWLKATFRWMSRLFHRPSDPAYYIEDCRISSELDVCTLSKILRHYNLRLLPFFSQTNSQVRNNEMLTFGSDCCSDFRLWGVMNSKFGCWKEGGGDFHKWCSDFWIIKCQLYKFALAGPNCIILLLFLYFPKVYVSHRSRPGIEPTD